MPHLSPVRFHPYGFSVLSVILALVLMLALDPVAGMTQAPYLLFFGAVVISAWWGGIGSGLVSTGLAAVISNFFFLEPKYTLSLDLAAALRTGVFVLECILISIICGSLRTINQRLDANLVKLKTSEESLRAAHQHITEILDSVTDGFYTLDQQWRFTYINWQASQLLQRRHDELLGQSIWESFPEIVGTAFETSCRQAAAQHIPIVTESLGFITPDRWFEVHINPLYDGLAIYVQEVSDRKQAEIERLQLANERERLWHDLAEERATFEAVLRQMPEGVLIADAPSGKLSLSNEQSQRILNHSYTLDLELEQYEQRVPFQAYRLDGLLYEAHEYPLVRSLRMGEVVNHEEMELRYADGKQLFIDVSSSPVLDSEGQIISAVVVFQDITQRKQTEAALRASQERLQVALKNAPISVFSQDCELRYTWIENPTFDYQIDQVVGYKDSDFVPPEEAAILTRIKQQVLATGVGTREEVRLAPMGQDYYYDLTVEPLRDDSGAVVGVTCAAIDISELKQTELALRHSEERFRLLAEQVRIIPWEADPITGQFTYVGPQAVDIVGYPLDMWYTENFWAEHIYGPDRERAITFCQESAQSLDNYDFEYRMVTATGRVVWLYDVVNVVRHQEIPKVLRGIMIDITQRKRQEEAQQYLAEVSKVLATSLDPQLTLNQLAHQLVPHLADWCTVHLLEADDSIQPVATAHVNPEKVKWADAIRKQYPLKRDDPHGTVQVLRTGKSEFYPHIPDALLVQSARDPEHLRLLREVGFSSAMIVPMQAHGKTLGTITLVAAESGRLYDEADLWLAEDLARRAALAVDNAQLYQRAQQEQAKAEAANRIKDEFLAVLSHELRTPLNPILGWSTLLRTGKLDPSKTAHALETIERNAKLQTQLIEDLLDVSRILQGKLNLSIAPVNLSSTVEAALETVKLAAEAKSIDLKRQLIEPPPGGDASPLTAGAAPVTVLGDAARLQQVVWNLLTNAVKFTPAGGQVEIKVEQVDSQAQIQVSDTGKGIRNDFLPYVFDYFRQADGATTRRFGGLGLGLAIVRHLVELHGGTIQAASLGEGQGATFTVKLPLFRAQGGQSGAGNGAALVPSCASPLANLRVLLIDDDADARDVIAFSLEQAGATVTVGASATEAMHALEQAVPDVLVSDIGMPEIDGYMLIQQVRSLLPEQGQQVPAIALTAYAGELNHQQALAAGFQKHVSKPVEPSELVAIVAGLCGRDRGRQA